MEDSIQDDLQQQSGGSSASEASGVFDDPVLQKMAAAGMFYGRSKSKTHPNMREYIFATRSNNEIFDLEKSRDALDAAKKFLASVRERGGMILFVGTRPSSRASIEALGTEFNMPYVINRWLGGTLTNFKVISSRVAHMKKLREQLASEDTMKKYTKKEGLKMSRELAKLEHVLGGIEGMNRLPDAVFIVNTDEHDTAAREARRLNIPIVALMSSASDPKEIAFPIPGNDTARLSVEFVCNEVADSLRKAPKKEVSNQNEQKKKASTDSN